MNTFSIRSVASLALLFGAILFAGCQESVVGPDSLDGANGSDALLTIESAPAAASLGGDVILEANLSSTQADPLASGTARWEMRADGRLKFSTEVEDVSIDGNGRVIVTRAGSGVVLRGTINIAGGLGDFNIDTDNGQSVPVMQSGDRVTVRNAERQLILRGRL